TEARGRPLAGAWFLRPGPPTGNCCLECRQSPLPLVCSGSATMRGYRGGLLAFGAIVLLVVGGLGWVTADALRLEQEHRHARAQEELATRLQLALSLLDGRVRPTLAKED